MNASKCLKTLFALTLLTFCLPWFTYNAEVMGCRYGFAFWKWFLPPVGVLAVCLAWPRRSFILIIIGECALAAEFAALVFSFGMWQQVCNIKAGFHWLEGFRTAQPGYWVSVGFFMIFFLCYQIELVKASCKSAVSELNWRK